METAKFQEEMWKEFYTLKRAMGNLLGPAARAEGLTEWQAFLLNGIREGVADNISSLCENMGVSQGNASSLCKKLEQGGFLLRERSREDERVVRLRLTAQGEEALRRIQSRTSMVDVVLKQTSPEELDLILEGMRTLSRMFRRIEAMQIEQEGSRSTNA